MLVEKQTVRCVLCFDVNYWGVSLEMVSCKYVRNFSNGVSYLYVSMHVCMSMEKG